MRIVVLDEPGSPIAGACVDLWPFPSGSATAATDRILHGVTDGQGRFTVAVDLSRRPVGYPPDLAPLIAVTARPCSVPFQHLFDGEVFEPGAVQEAVIRMRTTVGLSGRVSFDGAPLGGHCVTAWTVEAVDPAASEVDIAWIARGTTAADGTFELSGLHAGATAQLYVSEACDRPARESAGAPRSYPYTPSGIVGAAAPGPAVPLGRAGSVTRTSFEVRAEGDRPTDAPLMGSAGGYATDFATRSADDPRASCAPDAAGPTVWRRFTYTGDRIGYGLMPTGAAVFAVYAPGDSGSLTEVGCVVVADGEHRNGMWSLPPGSVVMIQGLTGRSHGGFFHHPF